MKILLIQENGRHEKNRHFRECFSLQTAFKKLGHEAHVWGLGHDNYEQSPDYNSYDLIVNMENYDQTGWVPDLSKYKHPKKFLRNVDAHCVGFDVCRKEFERGQYDLILQATLDFVDDNSIWLPNAFDEELIYPMEKVDKENYIGFCGSLLNRRKLLDYLEYKHGLKKDIWKLGEDMVTCVNSYKIHFNINLANDINYRSFETIGCNTILLTNYNHQYEKLGFVDEENCLIYRSVADLEQKILKYRDDFGKIKQISENGYRLSKEHTFYERARS